MQAASATPPAALANAAVPQQEEGLVASLDVSAANLAMSVRRRGWFPRTEEWPPPDRPLRQRRQEAPPALTPVAFLRGTLPVKALPVASAPTFSLGGPPPAAAVVPVVATAFPHPSAPDESSGNANGYHPLFVQVALAPTSSAEPYAARYTPPGVAGANSPTGDATHTASRDEGLAVGPTGPATASGYNPLRSPRAASTNGAADQTTTPSVALVLPGTPGGTVLPVGRLEAPLQAAIPVPVPILGISATAAGQPRSEVNDAADRLSNLVGPGAF